MPHSFEHHSSTANTLSGEWIHACLTRNKMTATLLFFLLSVNNTTKLPSFSLVFVLRQSCCRGLICSRKKEKCGFVSVIYEKQQKQRPKQTQTCVELILQVIFFSELSSSRCKLFCLQTAKNKAHVVRGNVKSRSRIYYFFCQIVLRKRTPHFLKKC